MSMIDFGVVVFKNGFLVNENEFFMDMQKSVGWIDCSEDEAGWGTFNGNFLAYVGDDHFTAMFARTRCVVCVDKKQVISFDGMTKEDNDRTNCKVVRCHIAGADLCLRELHWDLLWMQISYRGDHYNIVYGYGIDPNMRIWNNIKERYLGKKTARRVDAIYKRQSVGSWHTTKKIGEFVGGGMQRNSHWGERP